MTALRDVSERLRREQQRAILLRNTHIRWRPTELIEQTFGGFVASEKGEKRDHVVAPRKVRIGEEAQQLRYAFLAHRLRRDLGGHAVNVGFQRCGAYALLEGLGARHRGRRRQPDDESRECQERMHAAAGAGRDVDRDGFQRFLLGKMRSCREMLPLRAQSGQSKKRLSPPRVHGSRSPSWRRPMRLRSRPGSSLRSRSWPVADPSSPIRSRRARRSIRCAARAVIGSSSRD